MDHINNLKVKDLRVLLCYNSGSEKLMRSPKKVKLVEDVKYFLESIGTVLYRDIVVGCLLLQINLFMNLVKGRDKYIYF